MKTEDRRTKRLKFLRGPAQRRRMERTTRMREPCEVAVSRFWTRQAATSNAGCKENHIHKSLTSCRSVLCFSHILWNGDTGTLRHTNKGKAVTTKRQDHLERNFKEEEKRKRDQEKGSKGQS
ncbi:hypothetical protein NDU88_005864 [Pleurodeles waltl]|uniref:Uncharacterized protein n=1 Tax=Pleurodeles waltl TaxID=8319 RepID=A0AAV7UMZ3_PLEWA|nr:hypothetical protein NDU88_005864 [Pleurodeles waltl]